MGTAGVGGGVAETEAEAEEEGGEKISSEEVARVERSETRDASQLHLHVGMTNEAPGFRFALPGQRYRPPVALPLPGRQGAGQPTALADAKVNAAAPAWPRTGSRASGNPKPPPSSSTTTGRPLAPLVINRS